MAALRRQQVGLVGNTVNQLDDGADLVGTLGQGVHLAAEFPDSTARRCRFSAISVVAWPLVWDTWAASTALSFVTQNAGHLAQAALGARGVAELGHTLHHGQQVIAVALLLGLGACSAAASLRSVAISALQGLLAGDGCLEVGLELFVLLAIDPHGCARFLWLASRRNVRAGPPLDVRCCSAHALSACESDSLLSSHFLNVFLIGRSRLVFASRQTCQCGLAGAVRRAGRQAGRAAGRSVLGPHRQGRR
jgi:hypothetical protein